MTNQLDYKKLRDYDLQKDYVDKLTDQEKLELFRDLDERIQGLAGKEWNSQENYSDKFIINWITKSYSEEVLTLFTDAVEKGIDEQGEYEPYDIDHILKVYFNDDFEDYSEYEEESYEVVEDENCISFLCPAFLFDVPREFLFSWLINWSDINPKFVVNMTLEG